MKLYEITASLNQLWEQTADILGDSNSEPIELAKALAFLEGQMQQLEGTHADKCLNVACLIKNIEAEAGAIKAEEQKLGERRKSADRKAEWLRAYLTNNMEPGTNMKDARAIIGWRKSTAVEVNIPTEQLPENLRRTKTIIEADKAAIKTNLEAGQTVEGCSLVQRFNLQIK